MRPERSGLEVRERAEGTSGDRSAKSGEGVEVEAGVVEVAEVEVEVSVEVEVAGEAGVRSGAGEVGKIWPVGWEKEAGVSASAAKAVWAKAKDRRIEG